MQTRAQQREGQVVPQVGPDASHLLPSSGPVTPTSQSLPPSDVHTPASQMALPESQDTHRKGGGGGERTASVNQAHYPMTASSVNLSPSAFVNNHLQPTPDPSLLSPYHPHLAHTPDNINPYFAHYPQPYPSNPYYRKPYARSTSYTYTVSDVDDMYDSDAVNYGEGTDMSDAPSSSKKLKVPRPPNAWILYRSEMLREIGKGRYPEGFDDAIAESGVGAGTGQSSSGEDAAKGKPPTPPTSASSDVPGADAAKDKGDMPPQPTPQKMKKGKKGSKDPTPGLLTLGSGKTGRGIPQADISKLISIMWKREKAEVRAVYEGKAEAKKAEHQKNFPDYKFQPMRRSDKLKQREEREREKEMVRRQKEIRGLGGRSRKKQSKGPPSSPFSGQRQSSYPRYSDQFYQHPIAGCNTNPLVQHYWFDANNRPVPPPSTQDGREQFAPFPIDAEALPSIHPSVAQRNWHAQPPMGAPQPCAVPTSAATPDQRGQAYPPQPQPSERIGEHPPYGQMAGPVPMPATGQWAETPLGYPPFPPPTNLINPGEQISGPYTFEAIGIDPADLADFATLPSTDLQDAEIPDADSLVALWGHLEQIPSDNQPVTLEGNYSYVPVNIPADQAAEFWPELEMPIPPHPEVQLSSGVASQIAANWRQDLGQLPPTGPYPPAPYNPQDYMRVPWTDGGTSDAGPSSLPMSQSSSSQGPGELQAPLPILQGPLLGAPQPLSPMSWLMPGQQPVPLLSDRNNTTDGTQDSDAAPGDPGQGQGSDPATFNAMPRHVSSTAYANGDYGYTSGFLSPTGWGDRAISFSALAADAFDFPSELAAWDGSTTQYPDAGGLSAPVRRVSVATGPRTPSPSVDQTYTPSAPPAAASTKVRTRAGGNSETGE